MKTAPKYLRTALSVAVWFAIWFIVSSLVNKEILLPSPESVFKILFQMAGTSDFYITVGLSFLRIFTGFAFSFVIGFILGIISAKIILADDFLSPVVTVLKTTPVASIIILALVWIDKQIIPAAISFLIVFPVVYENTKNGFKSTDKKLLEMAKVFEFGKIKTLKKIYFKSVLPYIFAAFKASLGLAWKSGVAAEVLCQPKYSIGASLYNSKIYLETDKLFAWTLSVIVLSVILEKLILVFFSKIMKNPMRGEQK